MLKKLIKILNERKRLILFTSIKMVNAFIGLFINMFIVRKVTVEEFGTYSMILTMIGFLTTFGFSWSRAPLIFFGIKNINKTFWSRAYIVSGSLLIILLSFMIIGDKIENYIGLSINKLLIIWIFVKIIIDSLNTYFLAIKEQINSSLVMVTGKICLLISVIFLDYSLLQLISLSILCDLSGIIYIFKLDKRYIRKPELDRDNLKKVLSFGVWQILGFSGVYLINFGDNFVIKYFMDMTDVGIYNAGYKLFNATAGLSLIFSSYFAPIIVDAIKKDNKNKIKQIFYKERIMLILFVLIPHLLVIIFSKRLILLIYGKNYLEVVEVLQILMIGSFIKFTTAFNRLIYNSTGNYKVLQFWNLLQMILNIFLDVILIKYFGILGAAIATTIAILITSIFDTLKVKRILKKIGV